MKKLGTLLLGGLAALGLAGCGNGQQVDPDLVTVRIGLVGEQLDQWEHARDTLLDAGINLELVRFTGWVEPNVALAEGELDLNAFQTYSFLDNFNDSNNQNLVPIAETVIMHFGIYSDSVTDLADVPVGGQVSIPDDPTNLGRALLVLQSAGLIEIDPAVGFVPTPNDIVYNPLELTFVEVTAQQLPRTMSDVALALMNASIANDAGLNPHEDALFLEPLTPNSPFINIIAARLEDADNEVFQTIVEHFQTDEVAAIIDRISAGASFPVWTH